LIARRLYLGGLSILTALASIFIIATIAAKIRRLDITCGCFGHASKNWNFTAHIALDLVLLGALLLLMRSSSRHPHSALDVERATLNVRQKFDQPKA
jgi:hypothetical protein